MTIDPTTPASYKVLLAAHARHVESAKEEDHDSALLALLETVKSCLERQPAIPFEVVVDAINSLTWMVKRAKSEAENPFVTRQPD